MKNPYLLASFLLLPLALGLTLQEDDLVFDDVGEESASSTAPTVVSRRLDDSRISWHDHKRSHDSRHQVKRLWSVPRVVVPVGHVLKLRIPRQPFVEPADYYQLVDANGKQLMRWLYWDDAASTLMGVPSKKDAGSHRLSIKAIGMHGETVKDLFVVQVVPENHEELKHRDGKTHCNEGEDQTILMLLLNARFDDLSPSDRVNTITNLAGFLGLHVSGFSMHPESAKDSSNMDSSVILSGPGNSKHRKEKHFTTVQWQVGCDGHLWRHQTDLVKRLRDQAKDGTLAEVMQHPVLLWRVKTDSNSLLRNRREVGSGEFDNTDDYDGYDDDYEYENGGEEDDEGDGEDSQVQPTIVPETNSPREHFSPEHPHRHHHGEESIDWNTEVIDDRIPLVNQANTAENAVNRTTTDTDTDTDTDTGTDTDTDTDTSPTTTTTELTSPPSTIPTTTTTITTTTTSTTTTQQPPSTATGTFTTSTTTTTTTADTNATSTTTTTTTSSPSTTIVPSTTEPPQPETTEEWTDNTRHEENESINVTSATMSETITTTTANFPSVIVVHSSTVGPPTTVVERTETDVNSGAMNITTEEPTEHSSVPTTKPTTTLVPTAIPANPATTFIAANTSTLSTILVTNPTTTTPMPTTTQIQTLPPTVSTTYTYTVMVPSTTTTIASMSTSTTTSTPTTTNVTAESPRVTTENVEYGVRNSPPRQDRRLKKIPVTAGKPLSYVIPSDTFSDFEDGDTRRLRLNLYLQGAPLKMTHWLQFNRNTQEVYGLPLENDISTWTYELVAADSEGLNVTDRLDIHVQQHKLSRSVNHEFSIYLRIDKRTEFPTDVDWELRVIRSIAEVYGDTDTKHITVRSVDIEHGQAIFTWTNDSLPRSSECPKEYIDNLLNVLIDKNGDPSFALRNVLQPEIAVKRVVYQGIGQCEDTSRPEPPKVSTQEPKSNISPVPRNQVDLVNATVGQLLVFKVPEDTFYDVEDGSARNMRMSLLTIDRTPIPDHEWLQFDNKNQEFYGVPMRSDVGRKEYQLVVTDKDGASTTDGLVVVVHPAPLMHHTVEFSMTLDIPYESFAHSALQKRNFVEKLRDLYQDKDTSAISLHSISNGSTVIAWHNRTLPTSYCAHEEVTRLRSVLVNDNDRRSVTDEVLEIMGQKFPVKQITVIPMGICVGEVTHVHSPDNNVPPVDDSTSVGAFHDDYLITFVLPAIIIAAMLVLAGIIACVLYRRRRSGKMSVSEQDDERQSFRSKGIPVIFQDELDEKPDPGNKSPVILKEEKPPLPPPEYQKTEDGADVPMLAKENSEEPYQPPPPFATNRDTNRQNRPKPTPTYRKPPPYVPP
ncbi:dystroglycan 1-like isoform X1 [Hylaeus anthracinus]|uniref:dystroglycan 1-like isoform X1 n=1 Tax=Hylaeus anthracinus TaxID=313031 RepID=UPI0023B9C449|nr:dystroglycan 1-like isoform X1 [Hylaeus anthracinus]XP_054010633.1 dystroglycan 1-like isoform X1 [Hylaeus anthracinus]XP_054010634.1 dystroglycan 1-like isoform X1 [Hylaeus anthracinus]XP_054010635.1 dystroglycan 1-like isoform X1 [Hylaeus anthracinus]